MDSVLDELGAYAPFVAALVLVGVPMLWSATRHIVTLIHEAGHAIAALATGRQLMGIRLHSDTSGLTLSRGKPRGMGMVLTTAAGYAAPPLLSIVASLLIAGGHVQALAWGTLILSLAMLFMIRNLFGAVLLVVIVVGLVLLGRHTTLDLQVQLFYVVIWLLVLGNVRTIGEGARNRSGRSDLDGLSHLTHLPRGLWVLVLYVGAIASGFAVWHLQGLAWPAALTALGTTALGLSLIHI